MPASLESSAPSPVLLFDGECGLCNRVVRLLLRLDREGRLRFAPLQGVHAQAYLRAAGLPTENFDTLVLVGDWDGPCRNEYLLRTDAVVAALRLAGPLGREFAAVVAVFPARWRDAAYRLVARFRYRLFGEWRPRPLPRPEWAARFLA